MCSHRGNQLRGRGLLTGKKFAVAAVHAAQHFADGGVETRKIGITGEHGDPPPVFIVFRKPMRLLVVIETKPDVLTGIVGRQPMLRDIVGNGWVTVVAMDPETGEAHVFRPGLGFRPWVSRGVELPVMSSSAAWYAGHTDFLPPVRIAARSE